MRAVLKRKADVQAHRQRRRRAAGFGLGLFAHHTQSVDAKGLFLFFDHRKMIQLQVHLQLPCYDFYFLY